MSIAIKNPTHSWLEKIDAARDHFSSDDAIETTEQQANDSLAWMRRNKSRYTTDGALESDKGGWWAVPAFTEDEIHLETRRMMLRHAAYEHGIFHFVLGLRERGLLEITDAKLKLITDATTPGVINQLINHTRADGPGANISLAHLGKLYGYTPGAGTELVRDNKLIPLCEIGVLKARFKSTYAISLGPVAEIFHNRVYFTIINEMKINGE